MTKYAILLLLLVSVIILFILRTNNIESISATSSSEQEVKSLIRQEIRNLLSDGNLTEQSMKTQELYDDRSDWLNLKTRNFTNNGERSTDILTVNYFTNEKTLNATLWLYFPFKDHPGKYEEVNYGMLIDADFLGKKSGYLGIDYQLEIQWDKTNQMWSKTLEQWSATGNPRVLEKVNNYTGFFEKDGHYVVLSIDLGSVVLQKNYMVAFYAGVEDPSSGDLITDFTRKVIIPTPEIVLSTSPNNVALRPGERKFVELRANSTNDYDVDMVLPPMNLSEDIQTDIRLNQLHIPSHGMATTPMVIRASESAPVRQFTFFILANSTPSTEPDETTISETDDPISLLKTEPVLSQSAMTLTVLPPLSIAEAYGNIISGISLLIFLLVPTLFSVKPIFTKRLPDLIDLEHTEILNIDVAIIAGVLIFLSLEGFEGFEQTQVTFITANIVFPFAISAIAALTRFKKFATRLTIAGFVNLMVSIVLIASLR